MPNTDKALTGGIGFSVMVSRIGVGLLLSGVFVAVIGAVTTTGDVVAPDFNGWRVAFHGGILVILLAVATIAVKPTTPGEVLIATAFGVTGHIGMAVWFVVISGGSATVAHTLTWQILPVVPVSVGYILGGLHSVSAPSDHHSLWIAALSVLAGFIVWFGSYGLYVLTHDTTGELGYHHGFLIMAYIFVLLADVIGATFLYVFWRVTERITATSTASSQS